MYTPTCDFWQLVGSGPTTEAFTINNPQPGPHISTINPGGFQESSEYEFFIHSVPITNQPLTGAAVASDRTCVFAAETLAPGSQLEESIQARADRPRPQSYDCPEMWDGVSSLSAMVNILDGSADSFLRNLDREL